MIAPLVRNVVLLSSCIFASCGGGSGGGEEIENGRPIASISADDEVSTLDLVVLNGALSADPDSDALTYAWSLVEAPAGSAAQLSNSSIVNPTFTPDRAGSYRFSLVVSDGSLTSTAATAIIVAMAPNSPPVADAGVDLTAVVGVVVSLDGSGSSDADGDNLSYQWEITDRPVASTAILSGDNTISPQLIPDRAGIYSVRLTVSDGQVSSTQDTVLVSADIGNVAPTANAGIDAQANTGQSVTLDGSGSSDPNGSPLSYQWSFVSVPQGSTATLAGATTASPSFVADLSGPYQIQLVVGDGSLSSAADQVTVTVAQGNRAPIADAGANQSLIQGQVVTLNGSASSDPDSDPLTFQWALTSAPVGSAAALSSATAVSPTFIADIAGNYVVTLAVSDGMAISAPDSVSVVASVANAAPIANAGVDQSVTSGSVVQLDGSASSDDNGDSLTYSWSFLTAPAGSTAALNSLTAANPAFTADRAGTFVVRLTVNDGQVTSAADTVTITAAVANSAPVANAGGDQSVAAGTLVQLDGSASSDANSDLLTYSWSFTSKPAGSTATLSSPMVANPTFMANLAGAYVLQLVVNDGQVSSVSDTVTVTAAVANSAPVANAGVDQSVPLGGTVQLNGSTSSDANGDTLTYSWSFTSRPTGSTATLSSSTIANPTFEADRAGAFVVRLVVNDGQVSSASDTVTITTINRAPTANASTSPLEPTKELDGTVFLSSSGSSDPDGDPLTYAWSFTSKPAGSTATFSSPTSAFPTFKGDRVGNFVVQLVVSDGKGASASDSFTVRITSVFTLSRTVDPIDDSVSCTLFARGSSQGFTIFFGFSAYTLGVDKQDVLVASGYCGSADCYSVDNSASFIRVDSNTAVSFATANQATSQAAGLINTTDQSPDGYAGLLNQLKTGNQVTVRTDPENQFFPIIDSTWKLEGISEAIAEFNQCSLDRP